MSEVYQELAELGSATVYEASSGVLRTAVDICRTALDYAYQGRERMISKLTVLEAVDEVLKGTTDEAVITSGPPHSSHLVGRTLKRRLGLRWIADLRDPLVDNWAASGEARSARRSNGR